MKNIEERVQKRVKRVRIQNALLATVYGMGAVTLAMVAPNTLQLLKVMNPYLDKRFNPSRRLQQATGRLVARGMLEWKVVNGKKSLQVTTKGKSSAQRLVLESVVNDRKKKKWDGRWRIVSFDIWEKHRDKRQRLRNLLIYIGFQKVHASLWVYPYDCEELIAFMRTDLRIGRGVLYFVADAIEGEEELLKHFKLRGR